jgi:hypothetical protein
VVAVNQTPLGNSSRHSSSTPVAKTPSSIAAWAQWRAVMKSLRLCAA